MLKIISDEFDLINLNSSDHQPVNSQHLVDAFETVMNAQGFNDFNFDAAFRSWELQKGFPVVHVTFDQSQFRVTQQRFFTSKPAVQDDTSSWYIPLNFATASTPNFADTRITNYFVNGQNSLTIAAPAQFNASQWFIFNKQQVGYYRVNYDPANWNAIINALHSEAFGTIHVLNRAQLMSDSLAFAAGGYLGYDTVFGILSSLSRETEYTTWNAAESFINNLFSLFGLANDDLNVS